MRILAITHLFPHADNTVQGIFAARQFTALRLNGAEVSIFFAIIKIPAIFGFIKKKWHDYDRRHEPLNCKGLEVKKVSYVRLERGFWSCRWEGYALFHAMKKQVRALHNAQPFDVIYGRGLFPCADAAVHLSKYLGIPAVGAAIGGDVNIAPNYSSSLYSHYKKLLLNLDGVVANGTGLAENIFSAAHKESLVLEGVVDLRMFQPPPDKASIRSGLNLDTDAQIILFAGNLIKGKGVYELIEAFATARRSIPELQLIICGAGVEHFGMEKRIKELNISDFVQMTGAITPENMPTWMQASDIFVLPSYCEGMPNAVMEAMACGLPVIATAVGGLPAALGQCEGAILVEPKKVKLLSAAIIAVAGDTSYRDRMGNHARETAVRRFGAEMNAQKLSNYFETVNDQYKKKEEKKAHVAQEKIS